MSDIPKPSASFVGKDGRPEDVWYRFLNWLFDSGGGAFAIRPVQYGGTGLDTIAQGEMIYGDAPDEYVPLAKTSTASYLSNGGAANNPAWTAKAPLTRVDDANVTLTLGGTPASSLLTAVSITVGWTGTLAASRLNANVVQAVTNDTNIQGSIAAQTLTLTWAGQLAPGRGGTGLSSVGSAGQIIRSTGAAFALSTATYPDTATSGRVMVATGSNTWGNGPAPVANGTYTFDATTPGNVTSITTTNGLITAVTTL